MFAITDQEHFSFSCSFYQLKLFSLWPTIEAHEGLFKVHSDIRSTYPAACKTAFPDRHIMFSRTSYVKLLLHHIWAAWCSLDCCIMLFLFCFYKETDKTVILVWFLLWTWHTAVNMNWSLIVWIEKMLFLRTTTGLIPVSHWFRDLLSFLTKRSCTAVFISS